MGQEQERYHFAAGEPCCFEVGCLEEVHVVAGRAEGQVAFRQGWVDQGHRSEGDGEERGSQSQDNLDLSRGDWGA